MTTNELKHRSYAPYSGEEAYCVVESDKGHYFGGVRVENTVFPLTISELQSAVFNCLSEGEIPRNLYVQNPENKHLWFWKEEFDLAVNSIQGLDDIVFRPVILPNDNLTEKDLLEMILDRAVTLNSDFPVSALIKTDLGVATGVNIECTEWSLGLCAERIALAKAITYGAREFHDLYVHSRYGEFSSPCGACRQVILEHMPRSPVHLYHPDHTYSVHYSSDLLPFSFRSSALKQT